MLKHKARVLALAAAASVPLASNAMAADYLWSNLAGGSQSWDDAANWGGIGFPSVSGDKADLSVNLAADLTANIPAAGVTVSTLSLGGTGPVVITDVAGGTLTFASSPVILSGGVAGAVNRISAPIQLGTTVNVDATSTNSLTINGSIQAIGGNGTIQNNMIAAGKTLTLNGNIILYDAFDPMLARSIVVNAMNDSTVVINGTWVRGDGVSASNAGSIALNIAGVAQNRGTFILNAPQTISAVELGRVTVVLGHDAAMGVGTINVRNNNNNAWGAELHSTDDARTLANNILNSNNTVFNGQHSLTVDGWMIQSNNRFMANLLPAGKTVTLSGNNAGVGGTSYPGTSIFIGNNDSDNRTWVVDGTGYTIINGAVHNNQLLDQTTAAFRKRGTGTVELNNSGNTQRGGTFVEGGLLKFGAKGAWGLSTITVSANGAVWFTPGLADADFASSDGFLANINPSSSGILALPASDAGANLDFTAAQFSNAGSMSVGGQGDMTYTGTVTPHSTGYHWGGLLGNLTLNGNNRMTGANNVSYQNGGTVFVTGTQDYTGTTTLRGANMATSQVNALNKGATSTQNIFYSTVLEISQIANGGVASPLGASTSDAANLAFGGGTLRYVGAAGTTDRLFTIINSGGGTIESNGTGPLQFTNTAANLGSGTGNRTLTLSGTNSGDNTIAGSLADAGAGSLLSVSKTGAGKWILGGNSTYTGTTTVSAGVLRATHENALGLGTLTVTDGQAQYAPGLATATKHTALNITSPGTVDLADNDMVIDYTTGPNPTLEDAVRQHLLNGRLITSATSPAGTKLGYLDNAALATPMTSFGGLTVDADSVLIKFTYAGDSNLDGQVDITDLAALATAWQTAGLWRHGDFNYDNLIDITDLAALATNWQAGVGAPLAQSFEQALASVGLGGVAVPEPATGTLIGLGAMALVGRRRRA